MRETTNKGTEIPIVCPWLAGIPHSAVDLGLPMGLSESGHKLLWGAEEGITLRKQQMLMQGRNKERNVLF